MIVNLLNLYIIFIFEYLFTSHLKLVHFGVERRMETNEFQIFNFSQTLKVSIDFEYVYHAMSLIIDTVSKDHESTIKNSFFQ